MADRDCTRTTFGYTAMNDLATGTYLGHMGGLYPGGVNTRPNQHEADGVSAAAKIETLDINGDPDPNGEIVFGSVGMSNASLEFVQLGTRLAANGDYNNDEVYIFDGAVGGATFEQMLVITDDYWVNYKTALAAVAGPRGPLSEKQVQVVWFENSYDVQPYDLADDLNFHKWISKCACDIATIAQVVKVAFVNIKLMYLTSRCYGGYTVNTARTEPEPYWSGFGYKRVIEEQIIGEGLRGRLAYTRAPWLAWAAYTWADGLVARNDGLDYECLEFRDDGYHTDGTLNGGARVKVATELETFFMSDTTSTPWISTA